MRPSVRLAARPAATIVLAVAALLVGIADRDAAWARTDGRPNILWISSEDNGPHLGAYGDDFADTPNLDALAERGVRYRWAWSNAPVCAPARTAIITGIYPPSTGSQHMRSRTRLPAGFEMFPQRLRRAGYYTTNNAKEDYNLEKPGRVWDASSREAHWRDRPEGAPFFAVFNLGVTHESQIRRRPHEAVHDPAGVDLPPYHPDTPEVRRDWAQYYDKMTEMDAQAGALLAEVEEAGLADSTIVFYWGDHGIGLPRGKRMTLMSGLRVPMILSIPERFRNLAADDYEAGGESRRLVSFVDLAPTVLSLAGIEPSATIHGRAFAGSHVQPPGGHLFGFRGRMDERYDMVRTVFDGRWVYARNYLPHRVHGQHLWYLFETPTTRVWHRLFEEGTLPAVQSRYWEPRPAEELYDIESDRHEIRNLAGSDEHRAVLERLRGVLRSHLLETRDLGFLPEPEIHSRAAAVGGAPRDYGHSAAYPLETLLAAAELASDVDRHPAPWTELRELLRHTDSAVRAWGAQGLLMRGAPAVAAATDDLRRALRDPSEAVRTHAAEVLGRYGDSADVDAALDVLLDLSDWQRHDLFVVCMALNALDALDRRAADRRDAIAALPTEKEGTPRQFESYVPRLIEKILADLDSEGRADSHAPPSPMSPPALGESPNSEVGRSRSG